MDKKILNEVKRFKKDPPYEKLYEDYKAGHQSNSMETYLELFPGQSYGPRAEKWYRETSEYNKVLASDERGDFMTGDHKYGEYKFSYAKSAKMRFNFVQIRPFHRIDGYVLEVYVEGNGFSLFNISKDNMTTLLEDHGGLAHGTKKNVDANSQTEHALRGKVEGRLWQDIHCYHDSGLFAQRDRD
jgi:hypothetical protein